MKSNQVAGGRSEHKSTWLKGFFFSPFTSMILKHRIIFTWQQKQKRFMKMEPEILGAHDYNFI